MDTAKPAVVKDITARPPQNWREVMNRAQKAYRNRWNTTIKGTPKTPKTKKAE